MDTPIEPREDEDATEVYDQKHGRTTTADEARAVNLSESANKPPPAVFPAKITVSR